MEQKCSEFVRKKYTFFPLVKVSRGSSFRVRTLQGALRREANLETWDARRISEAGVRRETR